MTRYYLDHNATTPVHPEVIKTVTDVMAIDGNASSVHAEGRNVHGLVEEARERIRQFINAPVNGVIFTSGGTEAIHFALHGSAKAGLIKKIYVSALEHTAVPANAESTDLPVETIPATPNGVIDLDWLRAHLENYDVSTHGGFLVCLMLANNETGVIQPVAEAASIIHDAGGLLFVDAAQAIGKIPVNFVMLGADMMSFTGHKFGGPLGVGALIVRPNLALEPILRGGGHEMNRRAGTTNSPMIVGLAKAIELAAQTIARRDEIAAWRDKMQASVEDEGGIIWGEGVDRLPGTLNFSAPGFSAETQVMALDLEGLAISSGSACSSGKVKSSHVLIAMGASEAEAKCGVRVSLGWNSTQQDVDAFLRIWPSAYERIKSKNLHRGAA